MAREFGVNMEVIETDSYGDVFRHLKEGLADAGAVNSVFGIHNGHLYGLEPTPIIYNPIDLYYAFSRTSPRAAALKEAFDNTLDELASDDNSYYYRLLGIYLGSGHEPQAGIPDWLKILSAVAGGVILLLIVLSYIVSRALKINTARLRESELIYNTFVENSYDIIMLLTSDGGILYASPSVERVTGYKPSEVKGKSFIEIIARESREMVFGIFNDQVGAGGNSRIYEAVLLGKKNTEIPAEFSSSLLNFRGRKSLLLIIRDVRDRKRAEEEREKLLSRVHSAEKMEAVGRLAGGIAHDFNNIMASVRMAAELMLDGEPSDEDEDSLKGIITDIDRAAALVRQLLSFSRGSGGRRENIELNGLIEETKDMLRRVLGSNIKIKTALSSDKLPLRAEKSAVEQVLVNLLLNAREAMPDGGKVRIETAPVVVISEMNFKANTLPAGKYVRITIEDAGPGINGGVLDNLFEPFSSTKSRGSGLGLAVVWGAVNREGGAVTADNTSVYGGAKFTVYLPYYDEDIPPSS